MLHIESSVQHCACAVRCVGCLSIHNCRDCSCCFSAAEGTAGDHHPCCRCLPSLLPLPHPTPHSCCSAQHQQQNRATDRTPVPTHPPASGPNTGGKTASLKALGLAAVAAKCGLPLPAASPARLPCFDAVLADIGDEQSLSASLSTFSGHLRRISALRMESGSRSLVLLDEVGTGSWAGCCAVAAYGWAARGWL